jgi:hypothetical protein
MIEVSTSELHRAVETLHACAATPAGTEAVSEEFEGEPVWQGVVHVFDLHGHPKAKRAYAWSSPIEGSERRKFYAVLEVPPVASARDAVRAAIVAEHGR